MTDLLIPVARIVDLVVTDHQLPWDLTGEVSGYLRTRKAVEEYAYAIGRDKRPEKPLMLYGPDNRTPIVVMGGGAEAAEMQDVALEALDKQEETYRKTGQGFDFEDARERRGLVRREDFGAALADAFARRAKYLKAHQVTEAGPKRERKYF